MVLTNYDIWHKLNHINPIPEALHKSGMVGESYPGFLTCNPQDQMTIES